eukprot:2473861-Rhodomonas_salina.1
MYCSFRRRTKKNIGERAEEEEEREREGEREGERKRKKKKEGAGRTWVKFTPRSPAIISAMSSDVTTCQSRTLSY